jgi:2-dehydropantoate 2-reductase
VATKAYDAHAAAHWFQTLASKGAPIAVLQNGIEHRERFASYVSGERIVPVIVDCPVERSTVASQVRVLQRGPMSLKVPQSPSGAAFVDLFAGTAALAEEVGDWTTVAWRKLCHNAAGALSALTLQPNGVMQDETMGLAALAIVRECVAVGRAEGANLSDRVPEEVLEATRRSAPDGVNSMLADRLAGRPMEIDARNGIIVRAGKKHGIPTPANLMAVALLQAAQAKPL